MAMADAVTIAFVILHIVWWPISKLLKVALLVLSPFWIVGSFLLLPIIRLGQTIINILSIPFRVQWLERIETLYVYVGTAGLIGCITGTILFIIFKFLSSTLNIDATIVPEASDKGRTTAVYRAARHGRREETMNHSPTATPVVLKKVAGPRRRGLLSQAIIEEEDSDF